MQTLSLNIMVGMSGGVDSSVAAYLLKEAGHRVQGVFMKNWEEEASDRFCPAAKDLADAQAVCDQLDIELQLVNFADQYWERVFTHFLSEYRAGRTPNPDILCNKEIKFKAFLDYAKQRGADKIATGHYVRSHVSPTAGTQLLKGADPLKDQSYFLYALNEAQLAQSLFPVGDLPKQTVRAMASRLGLATHAKKDSTGICFIGERPFKRFLNEYLPAQPGLIQTLTGETLGSHDGLLFYTIGQRQGLHIGGQAHKPDAPWYVAGKDLENNILWVVQGDQHPALFKSSLIAGDLHWVNDAPSLPARLHAKTRYRQTDQACHVSLLDHQKLRVEFDEPQRAITPGQSVVFYQDAICLGGGIIEH